MYTRRYRNRSMPIPPPDYSGTALAPAPAAVGEGISPPPPALPISVPVEVERGREATPSPLEERAGQIGRSTPHADGRREQGIEAMTTRRNDLADGEEARGSGAKPRRYAVSRLRSRRPTDWREGGGFLPRPRRGSLLPLGLQSDDILLLGLLFLLLSGEEKEVRGQLDLIALIGFLFFAGQGGG